MMADEMMAAVLFFPLKGFFATLEKLKMVAFFSSST